MMNDVCHSEHSKTTRTPWYIIPMKSKIVNEILNKLYTQQRNTYQMLLI